MADVEKRLKELFKHRYSWLEEWFEVESLDKIDAQVIDFILADEDHLQVLTAFVLDLKRIELRGLSREAILEVSTRVRMNLVNERFRKTFSLKSPVFQKLAELKIKNLDEDLGLDRQKLFIAVQEELSTLAGRKITDQEVMNTFGGALGMFFGEML